jgi:hypothetical protein
MAGVSAPVDREIGELCPRHVFRGGYTVGKKKETFARDAATLASLCRLNFASGIFSRSHSMLPPTAVMILKS